MVAIGSSGLLVGAVSSIKVVPSWVQKLNQVSENVWLQVGQRFILGKTSFVSGCWSVVSC